MKGETYKWRDAKFKEKDRQHGRQYHLTPSHQKSAFWFISTSKDVYILSPHLCNSRFLNELNLCLLLACNEFQELKVNFLSSFLKLFFISIWSNYQLYISIIIIMFCFTSLIVGLYYIEKN